LSTFFNKQNNVEADFIVDDLAELPLIIGKLTQSNIKSS